MAKGNRDVVALVCSQCKNRNYTKMRNKVNIEGKLELKKFCKNCKKMTLHKEKDKLK